MDIMSPAPVISALDAETFQPPRSPRSYRIAPLTWRQRGAMMRDIRRAGAPPVDRAVAMDSLRAAVRELAPANEAELLAEIDAAEADTAGEDAAAQARIAVIEYAVAAVPAYAAMQDAQQRHVEVSRWMTVKRALRGWDGPGLPAFATTADGVPDDLLDAIPAAEFELIFNRAQVLIWLGPSAEGNFAPPSPSAATPTPSPEG